MRYELTDGPGAGDLDALSRNLAAYNDAEVGAANRHPLAIFLRTGDDLAAGLSGYTAWQWLFTQWLWVGEPLRGKGIARRMLEMAEAEAVARGCANAWIDTFNPVALRVYERAGYTVFGELPDFPPGGTRYYLSKKLAN